MNVDKCNFFLNAEQNNWKEHFVFWKSKQILFSDVILGFIALHYIDIYVTSQFFIVYVSIFSLFVTMQEKPQMIFFFLVKIDVNPHL